MHPFPAVFTVQVGKNKLQDPCVENVPCVQPLSTQVFVTEL